MTNITYFTFNACIAFYSFFYFLWQSTNQTDNQIVFFKWCIVGVVLINSAFVHLVFVLVDKQSHAKLLLIITHLINVLSCFGAYFWFYSSWKLKYAYGLWPVPSTVFHFYLVWWFVQVIGCFYVLYRFGLEENQGTLKSRFEWIFYAALVAYAGGATNWLVWYGINFPPYLNSGIAVYACILAYAIFRYRFLTPDEVLAIHRDKLALVGLLSASLNHEIKNPLFLLQQYCEKLRGGSLEQEAYAQLAGKMSNQITRMRGIVERLGDFCKPTVSHSGVELADLHEVIDNALFFVSQELKYRNINTIIEMPDNIPKIRGNQGEFEEVFLNLFMNACQAMPKGGRLGIRCQVTGNISPGTVPQRGTVPSTSEKGNPSTKYAVQCTITDTGPGIPKEDLKNIFKPFYTKKGKSGTGLGLYIVKTLVEKNGGRIWLESDEHSGASFKLIFQNR